MPSRKADLVGDELATGAKDEEGLDDVLEADDELEGDEDLGDVGADASGDVCEGFLGPSGFSALGFLGGSHKDLNLRTRWPQPCGWTGSVAWPQSA
jgi:hypothetical protein